MKSICMIGLMISATALSACQTPETRAEREAALDREIAARQGEEVDSICYAREIIGWSKFDDDAVLVQRTVNDWYRVELSGLCHPEEAFSGLALETRTDNCLRRGDYVSTPDAAAGGSCYVAHIYEWDEEASPAQTASIE